MKVVILGNQARAISNFWSVLIRQLIGLGHEVVCLVPHVAAGDDPIWEANLLQLGVQLEHYPLDRKGLNPINDRKTIQALCEFLSTAKPDVLFASTIKPVIYGAWAAYLAGFPQKKYRFSMITGLGYMFEADSFVKKILMRVACLLYRLAFMCVDTVFFQNTDDKKLFTQLGVLPASVHVALCKGTGVDVEHFSTQVPFGKDISFLFVGRLLEAKGLRDLYGAARIIKQEFPQVRISILGPAETGLGSVPLAEVQRWEQEGVIDYLGVTKDVRPYLENASVIVLPSWREGTPCSLMEAMSMGRAVIAANAPGSREVVRNNENGFLVPVKDAKALADAMRQFIVQPELAAEMGKKGRLLMQTEFSAETVAQSIIDVMHLEK